MIEIPFPLVGRNRRSRRPLRSLTSPIQSCRTLAAKGASLELDSDRRRQHKCPAMNCISKNREWTIPILLIFIRLEDLRVVKETSKSYKEYHSGSHVSLMPRMTYDEFQSKREVMKIASQLKQVHRPSLACLQASKFAQAPSFLHSWYPCIASNSPFLAERQSTLPEELRRGVNQSAKQIQQHLLTSPGKMLGAIVLKCTLVFPKVVANMRLR